MNFNCPAKFGRRIDFLFFMTLFIKSSSMKDSVFPHSVFFCSLKKLRRNKIVIANSNFLHDSQIVKNDRALGAKCEYT